MPDELEAFAHTVRFNDIVDDSKEEYDNPAFQPSASAQSLPPSTAGMKKSRSMFDLSMSQKSRDHAEALDRFYHFARRLDSYREGVKDHKLSFYSRALDGEFHFIRFETRRMPNAIELIRANDLHLTIREMGEVFADRFGEFYTVGGYERVFDGHREEGRDVQTGESPAEILEEHLWEDEPVVTSAIIEYLAERDRPRRQGDPDESYWDTDLLFEFHQDVLLTLIVEG